MESPHAAASSARNAALIGRAGALVALIAVAGCATSPRDSWPRPGDGPGAEPTVDLQRMPDARPLIEPIRAGGPNKPYEVDGRSYVPFISDMALTEAGLASWYGGKFHGRSTANGETYDMYAMTAAHRTMPLPSYARVRNPANGRAVIVRINDRGPFVPERVIDLSYAAAWKLGLLGAVAPVEVERITFASIRDGTWRRPNADRAESAPGGSNDQLGEWLQRLERPSSAADGAEAERVRRLLGGAAPR